MLRKTSVLCGSRLSPAEAALKRETYLCLKHTLKCLQLLKDMSVDGFYSVCTRTWASRSGCSSVPVQPVDCIYEACLISRSKPTGRRPKSTERHIYFFCNQLSATLFFFVQYKKITDVAQRNLYEQLFASWAQS